MIGVKDLSRHYGAFKAVDSISFDIQSGEVVGLLGHNGAGKTTVMKMLTGYLEPTAGTIHIDNLDMGKDTAAIQKRIGYLPENCPLWPEMTVIDYLTYQASLHAVPESRQQHAVARAIQRTALRDKATQIIHTLSRGYRQRLGVAQAILHDPDIIILDEPTNGLDPTQISQMRQLIRELSQSATVIISTHILQEVQAVCDRVLIMRAGKLAVNARLDELQNKKQLLVTVDNAGAEQYLGKVAGVKAVKPCHNSTAYHCFALDAEADSAPDIVAAVQASGDRLFQITPEVHNLETLFAEINTAPTAQQEVAHG